MEQTSKSKFWIWQTKHSLLLLLIIVFIFIFFTVGASRARQAPQLSRLAQGNQSPDSLGSVVHDPKHLAETHSSICLWARRRSSRETRSTSHSIKCSILEIRFIKSEMGTFSKRAKRLFSTSSSVYRPKRFKR